MGLFGFLERYGESGSPYAKEFKSYAEMGKGDRAYGSKLTEEGLGGLRSLNEQYARRVNDPLGDLGRGIFARARGGASDVFTRTINSGAARRRQLATQSGGALTPEQIAALDAQDRRDASEGLFGAERDIATTEAELSLTEASKFMDRMESISKTITGVGQDEKTRGLQAILASVLGRVDRTNKIAQSVLSGFSLGGG